MKDWTQWPNQPWVIAGMCACCGESIVQACWVISDEVMRREPISDYAWPFDRATCPVHALLGIAFPDHPGAAQDRYRDALAAIVRMGSTSDGTPVTEAAKLAASALRRTGDAT